MTLRRQSHAFSGSLVVTVLLLLEAGGEAQAVTESQYQAMKELHDSTGGMEWKRSDNWLIQEGVDDYDAPCTQGWWGVRCEEGVDGLAIVEISLGGNNLIGTIPESISSMVDLRTLSLGANKLEGLPSSLGELATLTTLIVDNNELTELPESIGNLSALGLLGASSNHLEELPDEIGSLKSLTILDVSGNRLSELPDLSTLDLLTLGIGGNRLQGSIESALGADTIAMYTDPVDGPFRALDFHWNALYASPYNEAILSANQGPCCSSEQQNFPTQTLAPGGVKVESVTSSTIALSWTPVDTSPPRPGGYHVLLSTDSGQTYEIVSSVDGKGASSASISDLEASTLYTIRVESYTHPHADALPAPYTLIWSNASESRSWGNQTGDNVVVASTLSAEETTSSGSASTGTSPDGESCGCVSSGGVDRSGLVVLMFLGPLLRRRRRSRSRRVNDA